MRASARSEVKLLERISSSNRLRPLQQRNRWTIPRQRTCVGRLPTCRRRPGLVAATFASNRHPRQALERRSVISTTCRSIKCTTTTSPHSNNITTTTFPLLNPHHYNCRTMAFPRVCPCISIVCPHSNINRRTAPGRHHE